MKINFNTIINGIALDSDKSGRRQSPRIVSIQSNVTDEIVRLRVYADEIEVGDRMSIIYLPHLKRGTVMNHLKN